MKYYEFSYGDQTKEFQSREKATKYLEKCLDRKNSQVDHIIKRNHKHDIEYVCENGERFTINRKIVGVKGLCH